MDQVGYGAEWLGVGCEEFFSNKLSLSIRANIACLTRRVGSANVKLAGYIVCTRHTVDGRGSQLARIVQNWGTDVDVVLPYEH